MTVLQVRGTSGSGKTWVVREVMKRTGKWEPTFIPKRRRPLYYSWEGVYILGSYENVCGGCDSIGSARAVYELIQRVREDRGTVPIISEGLLWSEDTKWTLQLDNVTAIFLTTPVEKCLEQIRRRRQEAGNEEPLNETNTRNRVRTIERARVKLLESGKVNVQRAPSFQAVEKVLRWIQRCQS